MLHFTFSVVVLQKPCYSTPSWRQGLKVGRRKKGGANEWVKKKLRLSFSDVFRLFTICSMRSALSSPGAAQKLAYDTQQRHTEHNKNAQTFQWCTECLRFGIFTNGSYSFGGLRWRHFSRITFEIVEVHHFAPLYEQRWLRRDTKASRCCCVDWIAVMYFQACSSTRSDLTRCMCRNII